jgi:hypothetical protein
MQGLLFSRQARCTAPVPACWNSSVARAIAVKNTFPSFAAVNAHRCASFFHCVLFDAVKQWQPSLAIFAAARDQDAYLMP